MNIAVLTTLNKKLYYEYGYKFFETYNWPFDLFVYSEDLISLKTQCKIINLFEKVPESKNLLKEIRKRKSVMLKKTLELMGEI